MSLSPFELMFPIDVNDASEKFETTELSGVTNLSGEYGIRIEAGDDYRVSAPSNWDADDWAFGGWLIPDFAGNDGNNHYIFQVGATANDRVYALKTAGNNLKIAVVVGGTEYAATFSGVSWSAGTPIYLGGRLNGGTLTGYFDSNGDNTLETQTDTGVPAGSPSSTLYVGRVHSGTTLNFEGSINLLITDDGSSDDAIQDRFNSGNGMALEDWFATINDGGGGLPHSENLVLHVGGNSDGSSVQLDTFAGASQLLSDPDDGGYQFTSDTDQIDFAETSEFDGAAKASFLFEFQMDNAASNPSDPPLFAAEQDQGSFGQSGQFAISLHNGGVFTYFDSGGNNIRTTSDVFSSDGERRQLLVTYDGSQGVANDRIRVFSRLWNTSTRSYGSWGEHTTTDSGTIPATLSTHSGGSTPAIGGTNFRAEVYDARWVVGSAYTDTSTLNDDLDQAFHDEWDTWLDFISDANDRIGSNDGTVTGATSVTDGRSLSGRFERYTRQGRYNFDGVDDDIDLGNWTGLDPTTGLSNFTTTELSAVTNLSGEYGVDLFGEDLRIDAPSNWDADSFTWSAWTQVDFDFADGQNHYLLYAQIDSDNYIYVRKSSSDSLIAVLRKAGGSESVATLSGVSWSAGDTVFIGVRYDGSTLTVYFDSDSDNTLETATAATSGIFDAGTWEFLPGRRSGNDAWTGSPNLLITDDGSSDDAIQDRFNSGNGQALEDWLATINDGGGGLPHSENLVLHVGGDSSGNPQLDSFAGATQLLSDPDDGGYSFGGSDDINYGAFTETDGQNNLTVWGEIDVPSTVSADEIIIAHWNDSNDGQKSWRIYIEGGTGELHFEYATDGAGGSDDYTTGSTDHRGTRILFFISTDTPNDQINHGYAVYNSSTRSYGAWTTGGAVLLGAEQAIRTPSAVDLTAGEDAGGNNGFNGTIYDLRLNSDTQLADATLTAQELDQAYHDEFDHWWPLEGDANDQIGSLNGTITGATSVTDGRSHSGRFERYTRQGRYNADGTDDVIDFGAYTDLDGAVEASFWGEYERDSTNTAELLIGRQDNSDDAKKQFSIIIESSTGKLQLRVATDGAGGVETYIHSTVLNAGDRFRWFVRFKGDEGTNADKVQMGVSVYDPATGTYGAWTTEQLGDASTPGSFRTPTAVNLTSLKAVAGTTWAANGKLDELRINAGTALSIATLEANTIYSRTDGDWDHAWEFDGDATDAIGALDGTVTGAQQVADGRQPAGWSGVNLTDEFDRANGANQVGEGVFGFRQKNSSAIVGLRQTPSVTEERWYVQALSGKRGSGGSTVSFQATQFSGNNVTLQNVASMQKAAVAERAAGTGSAAFRLTVAANDEAHVDDWRAYELATVSPSTAIVHSEFSMFGVFTPDDATTQSTLFGRYDGAGDERQVLVLHSGDGKFQVFLSGGGTSGTTAFCSTSTGEIVSGTTYAFWIRYDGGGVTNADKVKIALTSFDPSTGTYASFTEKTLTFTGASVPSSLHTVSGSVNAYFGRDTGGNYFNGKIDHWQIAPVTAVATGTLDTIDVYSPPQWRHRWDFDGDAEDSGSVGGVNGTVTGAQQVADGRQHKVWGAPTNGVSDRTNGSNYVAEGSYAMAAHSAASAADIRQSLASMTEDRWAVFSAEMSVIAGSGAARMRMDDATGGAWDATVTQTASTKTLTSKAHRIQATGAGTFSIGSNTSGEANVYGFDDLRAYELATVSASTATKALPTRVAFSVTNPGSGYPYIALALNGAEQAEAWFRNDSGTQGGPAGGDTNITAGWHTIGFGYDGTDIYVTVDGVKESTTVAVSGNFDNLTETTIGAARLGVVSHFVGIGATIEIGRIIVWDNDLTSEKRKAAHNLLRDTYTNLPEAV